MLSRRMAIAILGAFVAVSLGFVVVQELFRPDAPAPVAEEAPLGDVLVAYYFHGNRRCATCNAMEATAHEAFLRAFPAELKSGRVAWRTVNFDEERNAALRERYGLYASTIVLSDVRGGEERASKELEEIWSLVASDGDIGGYVVRETRAMLEAAP